MLNSTATYQWCRWRRLTWLKYLHTYCMSLPFSSLPMSNRTTYQIPVKELCEKRPGTPGLINLRWGDSCPAICRWGECSRCSSQGPEWLMRKSWAPRSTHLLYLNTKLQVGFVWPKLIPPKQNRKRLQDRLEKHVVKELLINLFDWSFPNFSALGNRNATKSSHLAAQPTEKAEL